MMEIRVRWILSENIDRMEKKMMMKWRWKCIVSVCVKEVCEKKIDWKWIMDECIEWIMWKNIECWWKREYDWSE